MNDCGDALSITWDFFSLKEEFELLSNSQSNVFFSVGFYLVFTLNIPLNKVMFTLENELTKHIIKV